jgi:hypothetical protein
MTHAHQFALSWWSLSVPVVACALPGFALGGEAGKDKVNG